MSVTAFAPDPMPRAEARNGATSAAGQRPGPSGQRLFEASADLLAAARALAANADASNSSTALGPALACVEASLDALAETARRIGEQDATEAAGARFDRLAEALLVATVACGDARRTAPAGD